MLISSSVFSLRSALDQKMSHCFLLRTLGILGFNSSNVLFTDNFYSFDICLLHF